MTLSIDTPAQTVGTGEGVGAYVIADDQMAAGSTLGGPTLCMTIKASGAVEKLYSVDAGEAFFGSVVLHFWDTVTRAKLVPRRGTFTIHPGHQEHRRRLSEVNRERRDREVPFIDGQPRRWHPRLLSDRSDQFRTESENS